tara:strand:- start:821 stop:991 length:171 start_codon:yes stop_codon:yes gene_type:complete
MIKFYIYLIFSFGYLFSQNYTYSGIDVNPSSNSYGINISPSYFEDNITITYFGHQN